MWTFTRNTISYTYAEVQEMYKRALAYSETSEQFGTWWPSHGFVRDTPKEYIPYSVRIQDQYNFGAVQQRQKMPSATCNKFFIASDRAKGARLWAVKGIKKIYSSGNSPVFIRELLSTRIVEDKNAPLFTYSEGFALITGDVTGYDQDTWQNLKNIEVLCVFDSLQNAVLRKNETLLNLLTEKTGIPIEPTKKIFKFV